MVSVRSCSWEAGGRAATRIPSGTPVVGTIAMVNPKAFDIDYSLSWDQDSSYFSALPPASPAPLGKKDLSIGFGLLASAEHRIFTFTLGKYVASINKTYPNEEFSFVCDSPPDPPPFLVAVADSSQKAILGILLPVGSIDDDLDKAEITWTKAGAANSSTATFALASLKAAPYPNPFTGSFDCYFQPPMIAAGSAYTFSVTLIDSAGQRSSAVSSDSVANAFVLAYDANGAIGTVPDGGSHAFDEIVTVAGQGGLALGAAVFGGWNTSADGLGAAYAAGSSLRMPAAAVTLYAQWLGAIAVVIDLGTQGLSFSPSALTVVQGNPISLSCANSALRSAGSGWKWYMDGTDLGQSTGTFYCATDSNSIGQHVISCFVSYLGITYSGSLRVTVSDGGTVGP